MPSQINRVADICELLQSTVRLYPGEAAVRVTVYNLPCGHGAMEITAEGNHPSSVFGCPACPYYGVTCGHSTTVIPRD